MGLTVPPTVLASCPSWRRLQAVRGLSAQQLYRCVDFYRTYRNFLISVERIAHARLTGTTRYHCYDLYPL